MHQRRDRAEVAADVAYQNAKANTPHTARMAHDQALSRSYHARLRKGRSRRLRQFVENESLKRFVGDIVSALRNEDLGAKPTAAQA